MERAMVDGESRPMDPLDCLDCLIGGDDENIFDLKLSAERVWGVLQSSKMTDLLKSVVVSINLWNSLMENTTIDILNECRFVMEGVQTALRCIAAVDGLRRHINSVILFFKINQIDVMDDDRLIQRNGKIEPQQPLRLLEIAQQEISVALRMTGELLSEKRGGSSEIDPRSIDFICIPTIRLIDKLLEMINTSSSPDLTNCKSTGPSSIPHDAFDSPNSVRKVKLWTTALLSLRQLKELFIVREANLYLVDAITVILTPDMGQKLLSKLFELLVISSSVVKNARSDLQLTFRFGIFAQIKQTSFTAISKLISVPFRVLGFLTFSNSNQSDITAKSEIIANSLALVKLAISMTNSSDKISSFVHRKCLPTLIDMLKFVTQSGTLSNGLADLCWECLKMNIPNDNSSISSHRLLNSRPCRNTTKNTKTTAPLSRGSPLRRRIQKRLWVISRHIVETTHPICCEQGYRVSRTFVLGQSFDGGVEGRLSGHSSILESQIVGGNGESSRRFIPAPVVHIKIHPNSEFTSSALRILVRAL